MKKIFIAMLVTFHSLLVLGQGATATLPVLSASPGTVTVPLNVTAFNNIAAISLYFEYDPAVVSYSSYNTAALPGLEVNAFTVGTSHRVGITWSASGATGSNVSGTLVNVVFNYVSGACAFTFLQSICDVTDNNYNTVPVLYTDGSIGPNNPALVSIPYLLNQTPVNGFLIPVNVDFHSIAEGVNSFTFIVGYDDTKLVYQGFQDPALSGIVITPLTSPARLAIEWFDAVSAGSLLNGTLLNMVFNYTGGMSALAFDEANCHVADHNVIEVPVVYTDGLVTQAPATIVTVTAGTITASPGTEVLIPVTVNNFTNIGAFDLLINYNQTVLSFVGLANVNPLILPLSNLASNTTSSGVGVNWQATSSALTIPADGKLFDLKFNYTSGSTQLIFDQVQSAVSDFDLNALTTSYVEGAVSEAAIYNASVAIPDIVSTPLTSVEVPVTINDFSDIGAFDLVVGYDAAALNFTNIINVQPDLESLGEFTFNATGGKLYISWNIDPAAIAGITIPDNETLFDMQFSFIAGSSELIFDQPLCAVSKFDYSAVNVTYTDGSVQGGIELQLKVILEGLYNTGTGQMNKAKDYIGGVFVDKFDGTIADQITVELHNQATYATIVHTEAIVNLNTNGTAIITIPSGFSGSYYITVKHRNHVETVSANPVSFADLHIAYDFTTAANKAYNSNMKLLQTGIYGFFAGDVNQDGDVNLLDLTTVNSAALTILNGYAVTDINGNGNVNLIDVSSTNSNVLNIISKKTP